MSLLDNRKRIIDFLGVIASFGTALDGSFDGTPAGNTEGYVDTGGGRTVGDLVIEVTYGALGTMSSNSRLNFDVILQGSNSSTFATPWVNLAKMDLGPWNQMAALEKCVSGLLYPSSGDSSQAIVPVVSTIPFTNDLAGVCYRYLRTWLKSSCGATIATDVYEGATLTTGIIYKAYVTKRL